MLLLVSGGIAAYKACYLTRLLQQAGFAVKVAMTDAAQRFVTPMTFQVLSENPVATDLWGEGQSEALDHIEYARWADLAVMAPATANILAKARRRHRRRHRLDAAAGASRPRAHGAGHERQHVAPPGDAGQPGHAAPSAACTSSSPGRAGWPAASWSTGRMAEPEEIMARGARAGVDLPVRGRRRPPAGALARARGSR